MSLAEVYAIFACYMLACYMPASAHHRIAELSPMPGVLVVLTMLPIGAAIEELSAITAASEPDEWVNRVVYLPLR